MTNFNFPIKQCDQAAEFGRLRKLIQLQQDQNIRLTMQDEFEETVVHKAAAHNQINILEYTLKESDSKYTPFAFNNVILFIVIIIIFL